MSPSAPAEKVWTSFMLFWPSSQFRGRIREMGKGGGLLWYTLRQREMALGG